MKENNPIDFKLQMAMIKVRNLLTKLLQDIRTARKHYDAVHEAIIDSNKTMFSDPEKIYEKHLKEHEDIFEPSCADAPEEVRLDKSGMHCVGRHSRI